MKVICHHNHPNLPRLEFGIRCHSTSPTALCQTQSFCDNINHVRLFFYHISVMSVTFLPLSVLEDCFVNHEWKFGQRLSYKFRKFMWLQDGGTLMERSGVNWRQRSQTGMNNMQSSTEQETCFYFSRLRVKRQKKTLISRTLPKKENAPRS